MKFSQSIAILYKAFFKFSYDSSALKMARRVFPADAFALGKSGKVNVKLITCSLLPNQVPSPNNLTLIISGTVALYVVIVLLLVREVP